MYSIRGCQFVFIAYSNVELQSRVLHVYFTIQIRPVSRKLSRVNRRTSNTQYLDIRAALWYEKELETLFQSYSRHLENSKF